MLTKPTRVDELLEKAARYEEEGLACRKAGDSVAASHFMAATMYLEDALIADIFATNFLGCFCVDTISDAATPFTAEDKLRIQTTMAKLHGMRPLLTKTVRLNRALDEVIGTGRIGSEARKSDLRYIYDLDSCYAK